MKICRLQVQRPFSFKATALAVGLVGCASGGPRFTALEPAPPGNVALYVYRPTALPQGINRFAVMVDGGRAQPVTLSNGTWARLVRSPGSHTITATGLVFPINCSPVGFKSEAGDTKFVELTVVMRGDGQGRTFQECKLSLMEQSAALQKIRETSSAD